ncbi:MucR family transcriptional regulator [Sphingobium sp. H39-3-25]|uniref:MucR family transcriptional regulator n=1 Tax=Sphingobium arseniciresistens TaxID=3030834 RepID=UPI0023B98DE9|nr:MucR family transcriptional regulator [Sphingobium arseniciresistens]
MAETDSSGVMSLTVTLLSAYFANNTVPSSELPALVEGTRRALLGDTRIAEEALVGPVDDVVAEAPASSTADEIAVDTPPPATSEYKPAVSIEESLASPDQILSLIDGRPYKALKRHLSAHGLTPAEYRSRYDLPADYPLVAPSYSAARREVARKLGLGGKRQSDPAPATVPEEARETAPAGAPIEASEPVVADTTPAKPATARRQRAKAVETALKPAAKKPKSKAPKSGAAKAPAASADATPKPQRSRVRKAASEAAAPAEAAPEIAAVAE